MATRTRKPKILFFKRTDALVQIRHESLNTRERVVDGAAAKNRPAGEKPPTKDVQSSEEIDLTAHDAPLESFDKALQALAPVVAKVMDCDPDWGGSVEIVSVSVSYTENGTRTAEIGFSKKLLGGTVFHKLKTPAFQIDDDKATGEKRQVVPNHADRVDAALKEAQRYVLGERGQGVLGFEEDEGKDDNVEQLPGMRAPGTVDEE